MNCTLSVSNVFAALTLFGAACFQSPPTPQTPPKPAPAPAPAPAPQEPDENQRLRNSKEPLRISIMPGVEKEKFAKQSEVVIKWLSKDLGRPIEIVPVDDYAAAVNGFATNKIDLAWLDAPAGVQAEQRVTDNQGRPHCQPLFAREQDVKATSYFIANKKLVDAGTFKIVEERKAPPKEDLAPLAPLAALKPKFATLTFSFGPKTSTTGHFMPRFFFERPEVGIDPEKGFKSPASYASGSSDAGVLASVASGASDLGVVSSTTWEAATDEQKAKAPVIYVTPEYMDGFFMLHTHCGPTLGLRTMSAFHRLDPKVEDQKTVLDVFGTQKFVRVMPANLDAMRAVVKSAKEKKVLE